ncbi:acyltransferase family protein [Kosakonia sacchari]|uniref:acyltransferase family protein n=1 Tax=Kosakonia sacchari TaxID=1158459 RepID=UPI0013620E43|nr:acyltransferase [Kosakonia sacchari]QHM96199.1 acyltransferase [Kosakonia sacchari]
MFFNNIQAMRGIASIIVFFVHLTSTRQGMAPEWLEKTIYVFGPAGVDIFFVISGFVVTLAAAKAAGAGNTKHSAINFMAKRIFRIYPAYWAVFAVASVFLPFVWLAPDWIPKASAISLLTLTYTYNYKVMVAWTLVYEMFFYLVLCLLILSGKRFWHALFIWIFIEIIAIASTNTYDKNLAGYVPLNPQIIQFCSGCVVAFICEKFSTHFGKEILFAGGVLFAVMCCVNINLANWDPWHRTLTLTLPSAMMIYGAVVAEREKRFLFGKPLLFLGNISFSLYLWHQLTFQSMLSWFEYSGMLQQLPHFLSLVIWAACGLAVGYTSYVFIEKPSVKLINNLLKNKPSQLPIDEKIA